MSMLPDRRRILRERKEIDLAALLEPAREVGGDLYDFFMIGPNRLCFLIGDVSDKGIPAALFMARGKAILRSAASSPHAAPDRILAEANRELSEGNEPMMYITVSLGLLDLSTGDLALSNAGHLPPLLRSSTGQCGWLEPPPGMPLGVRGTARFECRHLRLMPGDSLVVITDGVTEAQNELRSFFGDERAVTCLAEMAAPECADAIIERLLREVRAFAGGAPQSDDIAVVCIRYLGRAGPAVLPATSPCEKPPTDRPTEGVGCERVD
jgi:sigma-B regulation protein RsbU (phosphoserine phosphatase)